MAAKIDPNNKEVIKKLEEVKNSAHKNSPNNHPFQDTQNGLGIGLPTLKKKATTSFTTENKLKEDQSQTTSSTIITEHQQKGMAEKGDENMTVLNSLEDVGGVSTNVATSMEIKNSEDCSHNSKDESSTVLGMTAKNENKEEMMDYAESSLSNDAQIQSSNSKEPTYRFHNRMKHGSNLILSGRNYHLISKGKTLKFYKAKFGSIMEVKIAHRLEEKVMSNSNYQIQEQESMVNCRNQPSFNKMEEDIPVSREVQSEVSSCVTYEEKEPICQAKDDEDVTSRALVLSHFRFSTNSRNKVRRRNCDIKTHGSTKVPVQSNKRLKLPTKQIVPFSPTNFDCECRFQVGNKRKCTCLLPSDFPCHVKKKFTRHVRVDCRDIVPEALESAAAAQEA